MLCTCKCINEIATFIYGIGLVFLFSAIFIPDPKDGSLYAFGSAHDGLKVLAVLVIGYIVGD